MINCCDIPMQTKGRKRECLGVSVVVLNLHCVFEDGRVLVPDPMYYSLYVYEVAGSCTSPLYKYFVLLVLVDCNLNFVFLPKRFANKIILFEKDNSLFA